MLCKTDIFRCCREGCMLLPYRRTAPRSLFAAVALSFCIAAGGADAEATLTPFIQSVAVAAAADDAVAAFYAGRDYRPLWTGIDDAPRRAAEMPAPPLEPTLADPFGR